MTGTDVMKAMKKLGCVPLRQVGSHVRFVSPCGTCHTTVPDHGHRELGRGLLRAIEKDMEPCLGKNWLRG